MRFPNSISSLGIQSTSQIFRQLQEIQNFDDKFYKILNNGLANCTLLSSVTFNQSITALEDNSFDNCPSLTSLTLPSSLQSIGNYCFKGCTNLQILGFEWLDEEIDPSITTAGVSQLASLGSSVIANCPKLNGIVVPASINNVSKIDTNAFKDSSLNQVTFLGLPSSQIQAIQSNQVFGLCRNCTIFTSDSKKYTYSTTANIATIDNSYNEYGSVKNATLGNTRLRKFFKFEKDIAQWCVDPSTRTGTSATKFPQVACPIIVAYGDFKTSAISKLFLSNVIENQQFQKSLQTSVNCYLFVLSRSGQIERNNSVDQNLLYFRNTLNDGKSFSRPFVSLNFYYGTNFSSVTTGSTNPTEVLQLITTGAQKTGFSSFQYEPFDIKLEEPYVETIPTGAASAQAGYVPWWWTGSSATSLPTWTVS